MSAARPAAPEEVTGKLVRTERDGRVATITLDRPDKRNALSTAMVDALHAALDAAADADGVGAIVLEGAGPGFCAGADLGEFKDVPGDSGALAQRRTERTAALLEAIATMRTPVVAAVHGPTVGAGASLALACDVVVMAESARFAYPEARHGMVGALVMTSLVGHAGLKASFEALAFGDPIDAREALRLRMVNRVVADADLTAEARTFARRLADLDAKVLGAMKVLLRDAAGRPFLDALRHGVAWTRQARGL
jgi:enoyl-CoA hydratase/carnithine racemase